MKAPLPFLLAAAAVLMAAAVLYTRRAAELTAFASPPTAGTGAGASLLTAAPPASAPPGITAPPARPAPAKGTLMDLVERKLQATVKPETLADLTAWTDDVTLASMKRAAGLSDEEQAKVKTRLAATRLERQRNSLRLDLTPAERIAAHTALTSADDTWLRELLGEERFARYEASRKARQLADAESAASRGLSRISRAVPLRPDQKDALYAGFVTAALSPAAEAADPLTRFRITGSISEEPPVPAIHEEAKTILTPEQWAQYEEQNRIAGQGENSLNQHLLSRLPLLLASLQELLEESPAVQKEK